MNGQTPKSGSNIPQSGAAPGENKDKAGKTAPAAQSAAESKPKRGLFGRLVMWTAVLAVIAAFGAAAAFDYWRPYAEQRLAALLAQPQPGAQAAALAAHNEQLAALTARVGALEKAVQDVRAAAADETAADETAADETAALKTRLEALEQALEDVRAAAAAQLSGAGAGGSGDTGESSAADAEVLSRIYDRIAALENAPSGAAPAAEIAAFASRLEALENKTRETGAGQEGRGALMVALGDLRAAMASGAPYQDTLAVIAAVPGAAPESAVAALQACAASGAPAAARLREDFRAAAREAARVRVSPQDGGWINAVKAKAASLVSVRRIGGAAPETLDGKLAAAERALDGGGTAAAVRAAESLEGAPRRAVEPWLSAARARLGCEQGLAELGAAAAAWFGGG